MLVAPTYSFILLRSNYLLVHHSHSVVPCFSRRSSCASLMALITTACIQLGTGVTRPLVNVSLYKRDLHSLLLMNLSCICTSFLSYYSEHITVEVLFLKPRAGYGCI